MIEKIQLNSKILIGESSFSVVGIDRYKLINFFMKKKAWESFTISNPKERLSFSFTEGKTILWKSSEVPLAKKKDTYSNYSLNWNFSGIAQIQFEGDKGISQPMAELIWYEANSKIFLLERFFNLNDPALKIKAFSFVGTVIAPDEVKLM